MEELKKLLAELEGGIRPEIADMLIGLYDKMQEKDKKAILSALKQAVTQKNLLIEYGRERNVIIDKGLRNLKIIEKKIETQYKKLVAEAESKEGAMSGTQAEELIKQI
jgi:TRAP-type C4-dicarboxylate transport system substrate-binding protein